MLLALTEKRHHRPGLIAPLHFERVKIHRASVDSGRRAGFQASDAQRSLAQARGQGLGRRIASPTARTASQAHVHLPAEKSARGQHHTRGPKAQARLSQHTAHRVVIDNQIVHALLKQAQMRFSVKATADRAAVQHPVGLGSGGSNGGPLTQVQHPKLNTRAVRSLGHGATKCVNLAHQMTFANAPNGRITGHLTQRIHRVSEQQSGTAHTRSGQRRFDAGVTATDHNQVKLCRRVHNATIN